MFNRVCAPLTYFWETGFYLGPTEIICRGVIMQWFYILLGDPPNILCCPGLNITTAWLHILNLQLVYGNLIDYFIQNVSVISALIWTHIFDCSALIQNFYQLNVCRLHNHLGLLIGQFSFQGVVCLSILASPENKLNSHFSTETESNIKDCLDCKFNKYVRDLESI